MQLDNRIIYNKVTGTILHQSGEAKGDVVPHEEDVELAFIDVPYGSIDYSKSYIQRIDEDGNPVIKEYDRELSPVEIENAKLKEDIILLQTDSEVGGIL
ncbi:hypothetical protein [Lysinibacillus pakistanensis]|uniref:DUF3892 domain-containing protein n=1 Tax=Lysinibacillus pakistanensis TaxID=759811 RepID=A0AAX3WV24_9BACI|nr:hypothetical protein [Lysinibacillus pakistanensis]MDM5230169.1 hypothetical protein [Lysinibacillus pakistanensis]WHY45763.1 hypothetical protein QNH22_21185 [Lysinibacillus pakistanensis]WHY50773.1 hypothetical protein QNH24_21150 [Lysinibacillus pakistanensis]